MKGSHWWLGFLGLSALLLLAGCQKKESRPATTTTALVSKKALTIKAHTATVTKTQKTAQQRLDTFLTSKMQSKAGFYTNYLANETGGELATGHELLSESSGLYLRYLAQQGRTKQFSQFYEQTKKTFGQDDQFSYRVSKGKQAAVNATVDDLRILRSLYEFQAQTGRQSYQQEIKRLIKGLRQGALKDGRVGDYYDPQTDQGAMTGTLCYFDLKTLGQFETTAQLNAQIEIVQGGFISTAFPFYQTRYNYRTQTYSATKKINTTESLLTILHLADVGLAQSASLDYLTRLVQTGQLANAYDRDGQVLDTNQAVANYALALMIGAVTKRADLRNAALQLILTQQIADEQSPLNGGFGDTATLATYSYNNLMVLLALDY
ncbi:hypothetical protein [Lapidilactobacillus luobeiensis]|uniref:hypothetical protein n=1 Tax=Lapidilactobacillus luobeiensis TaxID=2950371 RepID=UPI0021C44A4E|nr:hypothetical protein [Lapidilactobacillus luobeiensis]